MDNAKLFSLALKPVKEYSKAVNVEYVAVVFGSSPSSQLYVNSKETLISQAAFMARVWLVKRGKSDALHLSRLRDSLNCSVVSTG